jgi:hypothetical protein
MEYLLAFLFEGVCGGGKHEHIVYAGNSEK